MAYKIVNKEFCTLCINDYGPTIGVVTTPIKEVDGQAFKNLSGMKELLPYEDWRLDDTARAKDLATRLSVEEIAGLMLFSPHQIVPFLLEKERNCNHAMHGTYNGVTFDESEKQPWELSDEQKKYLKEENMRFLLLHKMNTPETAARWNNELQQLAETMPFGIPVVIGSDPRHSVDSSGQEYDSSKGGMCSCWPTNIGMAATFSPERVRRFAQIVAKEYRAMGITLGLSPQVDLASDPRWMRYENTFGGHVHMVTDMAKAYCDGLQTTEGQKDGWGSESVAAIAKHWPGGGAGEGGRDAHYPFGKYAVYPGENIEEHIKPFTEGAFQLDGPSGCAAGVMPYYSIAWKQSNQKPEQVGNVYNEYIIKERLRKQAHYEGIVCTDWGITQEPIGTMDSFGSRCYGVEKLSVAERHLKLMMNGVDQFGGNAEVAPIIEAYELGCKKYGEQTMRSRIETSAVRILKVMFQLGIFENPYVNPEKASNIVGCDEFVEESYGAQAKSVVLLKNKAQCLPLKGKVKVYIPERKVAERKNFFRERVEEKTLLPVEKGLVNEYFELVDIPERADVAIVFMDSPETDPYSPQERNNGGNGYLPISLQYRPYTANFARKVSIAGGDFREGFWSRSYQGKTVSTSNIQDLYNVLTMRKRMGKKPVIACIRMKNPTVLQEIEPYIDGMVVDFGVEEKTILDILSGKVEPEGLLPMILPKNMETVERHYEDLPFDMEAYKDSEGALYTFGFGMNWCGRISDARTNKYRVEKNTYYLLK